VLIDFVADPALTPFSRIKRHTLSEKDQERLKAE
jgi:hypothetical protein